MYLKVKARFHGHVCLHLTWLCQSLPESLLLLVMLPRLLPPPWLLVPEVSVSSGHSSFSHQPLKAPFLGDLSLSSLLTTRSSWAMSLTHQRCTRRPGPLNAYDNPRVPSSAPTAREPPKLHTPGRAPRPNRPQTGPRRVRNKTSPGGDPGPPSATSHRRAGCALHKNARGNPVGADTQPGPHAPALCLALGCRPRGEVPPPHQHRGTSACQSRTPARLQPRRGHPFLIRAEREQAHAEAQGTQRCLPECRTGGGQMRSSRNLAAR